jgi:hypothetical protein
MIVIACNAAKSRYYHATYMSYAGITQERQMILLVCSLDCHHCSLLNLIHTSTSTVPVRSSSTYLGLLVQPYHEPSISSNPVLTQVERYLGPFACQLARFNNQGLNL